jgi:hypothetical protein
MFLMVMVEITISSRIMEGCVQSKKEQPLSQQCSSLADCQPLLTQSKIISRPFMMDNRKEATAFKYMSDGSGRDNYILIDSGGLHAPTITGSKN